MDNLHEFLNLLTNDIPADELEADIVLADIAGKLSAERIRRGMSQNDFAKLLGVNQSMVSKMESGECNFTVRKLIQIAHKLSIPCKILFGNKPILESTDKYAVSSTPSQFESNPPTSSKQIYIGFSRYISNYCDAISSQ